jgi:putative N6-adenine-specific DNA methylase
MIKSFVTTYQGFEDVVALELKEFKASNIKKGTGIVTFDLNEAIDLCKITYKAQSINRAVLLLNKFKVDKTIKLSVKNFVDSKLANLKEWCLDSFKIDTKRCGEHEFNSIELSSEISKVLIQKFKEENNHEIHAEFGNPKLIFYLYIFDDKGYFGIDFSGIDLAKRQYKIFNHPEALKGITGYYLIRESGYSKEKILIDPFMGSGVIPIEAAIFASDFPVQYYDKDKLNFTRYPFFKPFESSFFDHIDKKIEKSKQNIYGYDCQLRFLNATQKNSKLAGIDKSIKLSKIDVEWLDTKFEKESVDIIVSDPPRYGKLKDLPNLKKTYTELFYQANYVLNKKGKVVLLAREEVIISECAKMHKFKLDKKNIIFQGKEKFFVLSFVRVK